MSLQVADHTSGERAQAIRERLRHPLNAVADVPIALNHPHGLTGWQLERAQLQAKIERLEAEKKAEETVRKELEEKLLAMQQNPIPVNNVCNSDLSEHDLFTERADLPHDILTRIKRAVAKEFKTTRADIDCSRRALEYIIPRHAALYLCKILTHKSLPEIGRRFGRKDHTTVLHAARSFPKRMEKNPELGRRVSLLQISIEQDIAKWRNEIDAKIAENPMT